MFSLIQLSTTEIIILSIRTYTIIYIHCFVVVSCVYAYRLFLTMNSKYGEISRAMRNRGIELFILPEVQLEMLYEVS